MAKLYASENDGVDDKDVGPTPRSCSPANEQRAAAEDHAGGLLFPSTPRATAHRGDISRAWTWLDTMPLTSA